MATLLSLSFLNLLPVLFGVKKHQLRIEVTTRKEKVCQRERGWRLREQISGTAWRPAWSLACHFSFHPSHLLAGAQAHKSAYCTWASAELRQGGGGGGGTTGLALLQQPGNLLCEPRSAFQKDRRTTCCHPLRSMVRAEARYQMRHNKHAHTQPLPTDVLTHQQFPVTRGLYYRGQF